MAIDPDARSGLQPVTASNIIELLRGPDEVGSQVRLKIMKRGQKRASLSKHASLAGRLSLSPGAPARRDSLPQSPLSMKAEQLEFTLTRVDFREVEKVKDLFMSIVELRAHAQNPKPEHLARLANELEAGLLNLVDWTTTVEDKQRAHVADLERLVECVARDGAAALEAKTLEMHQQELLSRAAYVDLACQHDASIAAQEALFQEELRRSKAANDALETELEGVRADLKVTREELRMAREEYRQMDTKCCEILAAADAAAMRRLAEKEERDRRAAEEAAVAAAAAADADEKRRQRLMLRVAGRLRQNAMGACLLAWRASAAERKRTRTGMGKLVKGWLQRDVASAFGSWVALAEDARCQRKDEDRKSEAALNMVKRVLGKGLARVFESWSDHVAEVRRYRLMMGKVVLRLRNRQTLLAFSTWLAGVERAQALRKREEKQRQVVSATVARMRNGVMAAALESWSDHVATLRRYRLVMGKVVLRLRNRQTLLAFSTWLAGVGQAQALRKREEKQRQVVSATVARMRNGVVSAALVAWAGKVDEGRRMREVGRRVVRRLARRVLWEAFETWRSDLESRLGAKAEQERQRLVVVQRVKRMVNSSLSDAFAAWRSNVLLETRLAGKTARAMQWWRRIALSQALRAWVAFSTETRRLRKVERKVISRWRTRGLATAMSAWAQLMMRNRRLQDFEAGRAARKRRHTLGDALRLWCAHRISAQRLRKVECRVISRWRKQGVTAVMAVWAEDTTRNRQLRDVAAGLAARRSRDRLCSVWLEWRGEFARVMGERILKGRIVARRRSKSLVGLAFRHLEQEVDARRASLAAQERERLRAGRQRQGMQGIANRKTLRLLSLAFCQWGAKCGHPGTQRHRAVPMRHLVALVSLSLPPPPLPTPRPRALVPKPLFL